MHGIVSATWLFGWLVAAQLAAGAPAPGRFLVATRQVTGPVFGQSVILLLEAGADGSVGLIVNRPTELPLRSIFPEFEERADRVHLGGPVEPRGILFLFRGVDPPDGARRIIADVHLGQSADAMRSVLQRGIPANRLRAFLGYAGWGPGQLEAEIARGDWLLTDGNADLPFDEAPDSVWPKLIRSLEEIRVQKGVQWTRWSGAAPCTSNPCPCASQVIAAACAVPDRRRRLAQGSRAGPSL